LSTEYCELATFRVVMHLLLHAFGRTVDSASSVPPLCLAVRKSRRVLKVAGVYEVLLAKDRSHEINFLLRCS